MEGQSSVNIFDINKKKNQPGVQTNGASLQSQNSYISSNSNTYTREMEKLDKELETEGLKIERLSDEEKLNYVNSLTDSEYERLTQYRDAGYSFGSAKALVDLEKQINTQKGTSAGGYRGNLYQEKKPISRLGETAEKVENVIDTANYRGKLMEMLDDWVQEVVVPAMTVTKREQRSQALTEKYNNMTQEDRNKLLEEYNNDPKAKHFTDDTLQENLDYYWKQKNKNFWDEFRGADISTKTDVNGNQVATPTNFPSGMEALANVPVSAIANASAVARGMTNPFDNAMLIAQLLGTKEGRQMLAYRYLDEQGRNESIEKDPVSWVLDIFDLGSLFTNLTSKAVRLTSGAERMLGATTRAEKTSRFASKLENISRKMDNIADMGISEKYNQLLNKELNKLSEGNKMANMIGDYLSLTQRPLGTIRGGANPTNEKREQVAQPGDWTYEGLQKPINNILEGMKEKIKTSATGLTPEVRERIRQNPYIKQYWERVEAMIENEGLPMDNQKIMEGPIEEVGNELLRRLDEYESQLQENGREYQVLDSITRPFNISEFMSKIFDIFDKNGITITKDGLEFRTTANPADMNPINVAWNLIKAKEPNFQSMTIKEIREFRQQLRSLLKYHSDAPSTKYSKRVLKQLIDGAFNGIVHKEIPELAKVDEIYSKQIDELDEFKDGLVYQIGEKKGQIKDNFYSIISTMNTQNRQKMKERLERIFPDLGARVEAIRMLPIIAKAVQSSPQMMKALFQKAGFLGGLKQSGGIKRAVIGWLLGIVADELFAKPLGEKWRNRAINELIDEVSPEAIAKIQEIESKVKAGVELSEQEKRDLASALQQIAIREYQYLDEKHQKAFAEMVEGLNNPNPALPGTMDTIGPDGKIQLSAGKQVNNPEDIKPKTREERVQQIQEEYQVDEATAEEMTNTVEDFLDDIGGDINGNVSPREVKYDRFSTKSLEKLMDDPDIPESEKTKIVDILVRRGVEVDERSNLDQEFAYRINKLTEEEQRVGKVGKNKVDRSVAQKQQADLEKKREALKVEMRERYAGQGVDLDSERADEKYNELRGKPIEYINEYKKSKGFREEQAEREVLNKLKEERKKQPKFIRDMDDNMAGQRQNIVDQKLGDGYERSTTEYGDVFKNKETGGKGAIKYNNDGTITVAMNEEAWDNSGIRDILPEDTLIRFEGDSETIPLKEIRSPEYQTVGRANPNQKTVSAEEGWNLQSFKGDKTIGDLADEYGLKRAIVDKIFTAEGEEALGRTKGDLIELVREVKEGTPGHETFHGIFNIVNKKRRQEIIDLVMKHKGMTEAQAKEWLADSFSEYFSTGKFDTKPIPKGFVNKVKWFFKQVKDFINGTWRSRKKIQKLFDDIMENRIQTEKEFGNGDYEYQKKSSYDKRERTPEQKYNRAKEMVSNRGHIMKGFDYMKMIENFDPNLDKRKEKVGDKKWGNFNYEIAKEDFVDFFLTLKALANDKDFMEGLKARIDDINAPGKVRYGTDELTPLYNWLKKNKNTQLQGVQEDGSMYPLKIANEDKLAQLRVWEVEHDLQLQRLANDYSPDTIQWKNNVGYDSRLKTVGDLKELQEIIKDIYENGEELDPDKNWIKSAYTVNGEDVNKLIDKIGSGIGETFTDKRIRKVSNDMWNDVMDPMGDIFKDAIDNDKSDPYTPNQFNSFAGEIYDAMGRTYSSNVKEWSEALESEIKKIADYNGLKLRKKKVVPEAKLQNLGAKIRELMAIGEPVGEYLVSEQERDYNPTRDERIRNLVKRVYEKEITAEETAGIEATKQLVALSNMDIDNFRKQIKNWNGKNPMPSIAVTDINVPHTAFGDLTLVFGRDTVDPQVDERNTLFASDARTPTFPDTEMMGGIDFNKVKDFSNQIKEKIKDVKQEFFNGEDRLSPSEIDLFADRIANILLDRSYHQSRSEWLYKSPEEESENIVMEAMEDVGLDRDNNEGLAIDLSSMVEDFITSNTPEERIPARYFGGRVRYQDRYAIKEVAEKVVKDLPEKGKQKLIDDGYDEIREPNDPNSSDFQTAIERDLLDIIETIEDRPNNTPEEAGKQFVDKLIDEYGFSRDMAYQFAESIFGQIGREKLSADGFADKLKTYMPLNDGDMGPDFGEMYDHNLEVLNEDMEMMNRTIARKILEEWRDQAGNVDRDQYMSHIVDTIMEEWEQDMSEIIRNMVEVDLKEKDLGDDPTNEEYEKWRNMYGDKNTNDVMGGVEASLTDMKMYVKDVIFGEMLIDDIDRSRPLTPENVVEAMKNEGGEGGANRTNMEGSLKDMVGVEGKRFTDIEQVRGKNLAKTTHDDWTGDLSGIEKRYDTIISEINHELVEEDIPENFSEGILKQEIAWNYDSDLDTFRKNLEEENPMIWENVPDDYLQGIIDLIEMGKQVPIRFSESKPERVVDMYKEVKHILAPLDRIGEVMEIVKGTPLEGKVHSYDRGGYKDARSQKIKRLQQKYGDIFFSFGGAIMPIVMLLMMAQGGEDQGEGQQA